VTPSNDRCDSAEPLPFGTLVTGNSAGARPQDFSSSSSGLECSLHESTRGLFYTFQAPRKEQVELTWTTDAPGRFEVAVLTAGCGSCVEFSDFLEAEDTPISMDFLVDRGAEYVVVVSGEGFSDTGVFQLEVKVGAVGSTGTSSSFPSLFAYSQFFRYRNSILAAALPPK